MSLLVVVLELFEALVVSLSLIVSVSLDAARHRVLEQRDVVADLIDGAVALHPASALARARSRSSPAPSAASRSR